jgi:hypothetical protein
MPTAPDKVNVRSYNVGFGDSFLVSFSYPDGDTRHILIDFGSTMSAPRGPKSLLPIAKQIEADCGGKLHMVVATHRHADHISGFGGKPGEVITGLHPDLVLQPWTEDPDLEPNATGPGSRSGSHAAHAALSMRLSDMQTVAAAVLDQVPRMRRAAEVPNTLAAQIEFLGQTNIKNEPAVRNLMTMGDKHVYANFGTRLPIARLLPGIQIDVLGPPTLRQSSAIAEQRRLDPNEFWHIAARRAQAGPSRGKQIFPRAATARLVPQEARWVVPQIDRMRAEEMLAIVRSLDDVLNNTSLILLFEIGESRLLFPGDAQIENWSYALFDSPKAAEIQKRLADVRLYKVGHHGSLNATPKTLWNKFRLKGDPSKPDRLTTVLSTAAGKHGQANRGTEVPRRPLVAELEASSSLLNTQKINSARTLANEVTLAL